MPIMRALEFLSRSEVFLASGSPRRRELLQKMNPFRISYCAIPESVENLDPNSYALPEEYVLANVRNKLDYAYDDVPNRIADSKISKAIGSIPDLILTADTVVVDANEILEKPQSADDNFRMIRQLSGKTHAVITAVAFLILDRTKQDVLKTTGHGLVETKTERLASACTFTTKTNVHFMELDEETIAWYINTGEGRGKAGGYAIQERGCTLVESVDGCFFNVVGFPLNTFFVELDSALRKSEFVRVP